MVVLYLGAEAAVTPVLPEVLVEAAASEMLESESAHAEGASALAE
jgi:hypothetical protein